MLHTVHPVAEHCRAFHRIGFHSVGNAAEFGDKSGGIFVRQYRLPRFFGFAAALQRLGKLSEKFGKIICHFAFKQFHSAIGNAVRYGFVIDQTAISDFQFHHIADLAVIKIVGLIKDKITQAEISRSFAEHRHALRNVGVVTDDHIGASFRPELKRIVYIDRRIGLKLQTAMCRNDYYIIFTAGAAYLFSQNFRLPRAHAVFADAGTKHIFAFGNGEKSAPGVVDFKSKDLPGFVNIFARAHRSDLIIFQHFPGGKKTLKTAVKGMIIGKHRRVEVPRFQRINVIKFAGESRSAFGNETAHIAERRFQIDYIVCSAFQVFSHIAVNRRRIFCQKRSKVSDGGEVRSKNYFIVSHI